MESMTFSQWDRGIAAKVAGSWNLHEHFKDLTFFTMLSSIVGIVGNASQATYAAGNAFQDALAKHRTSLGLPAASLDLGAITNVGYVAQGDNLILDNVGKLGTIPLDMDDALRITEATIRTPRSSSQDVQRSQYITCIAPYDKIGNMAVIKNDKRFGTLRSGANDAGQGGKDDSETILKQALASGTVSKEEGKKLIVTALVDKLAELFSIEPNDVDVNLAMAKFGVDSLVGVELRNWLGGIAKAKVTIFEILQSPSLLQFAALVAKRSELLKEGK